MKKGIVIILSILLLGTTVVEGKSGDLSKVTLNNDKIYEKVKNNEIEIDQRIMLRGTVTILKDNKLTFQTKEYGKNGYYEVVFDSIDKEIIEGNKVNLEGTFIGKNKLGFPILKGEIISKL